MRLWTHPQIDDIELIYNLTVLMVFEFIMAHSSMYMHSLGRSWKSWLFFIFLYGIFALLYNTFTHGNQILILYGAVVLNRMLPNILNKRKTDRKEGLTISGLYALIYFMLFMILVGNASYIPRMGLTDDFLKTANYYIFAVDTGSFGIFTSSPQLPMCFGALYYLLITLLDVISMIYDAHKRIKQQLKQ